MVNVQAVWFYTCLLDIIRCNAYTSAWGRDLVGATASNLNHSCSEANVFVKVGETSLTIITMLDIEAGEQLVTN